MLRLSNKTTLKEVVKDMIRTEQQRYVSFRNTHI